MFVVQGNLTGATTKDFIRAVPAKKTACALKFLKRFGVPDGFESVLRRESTRADGKLLKLRNTDGYLQRFQ